MRKNQLFEKVTIQERFRKLLTGNRGQWSEIYLLCHILSSYILYGGDEDLNKLADRWFKVTKIIRIESQPFGNKKIIRKGKKIRNKRFIIEFNIKHDIGVVEIFRNNRGITRIPLEEFQKHAELILERICKRRKNNRNIFIPELQNFMRIFKCYQLRLPLNGKMDICMDILDPSTGVINRYKFSIKSFIGANPTLLNYCLSTTITCLVTGLSDEQMILVNNRIKGKRNYIKNKIKMVYELGGEIHFYSLKDEIFNRNMRLIDKNMALILGNCVIYYYRDGIKSIKKLLERIIELDPLKCGVNDFYILKFNGFLLSLSVGFDVNKRLWGKERNFYGCIMIKRDGQVVFLDLDNRHTYEQFLIENTKLDTPSSKRRNRIKNKSNENRSNDEYLFGELYKQKGNMLLDLGLQIRFDEPM